MPIDQFFKFKNYKTNSVLVVVLFVLAFVAGRLSGYFKHTDYWRLYYVFIFGCYSFHLSSLAASIINTLFILRIVYHKEYQKYLWLVLNCIPLFFWIWIFVDITMA